MSGTQVTSTRIRAIIAHSQMVPAGHPGDVPLRIGGPRTSPGEPVARLRRVLRENAQHLDRGAREAESGGRTGREDCGA